MSTKVVAIAASENVYFFRSLGFESYIVNTEEEMSKVMDIVATQSQIIIIDEKLQGLAENHRSRLSEKAFPIIIALPIDSQATGQGLEKLRADVEKAIGLRLF